MIKEYQFEKLEVWNVALEIIDLVYKVTKKFPESEKFGLISQLQRAAISIALNIAEGRGSGSDPEFGRFLNISLRSLFETVAALKIAIRLGYIIENDVEEVLGLCNIEGAKIKSLRNSILKEKKNEKARDQRPETSDYKNPLHR